MKKKSGIVFFLLLSFLTSSVIASEAIQYLNELSAAGKNQNYRGKFVISRGNGLRSMQIEHAVFNNIEYEKLAPLSGKKYEIITIGSRQQSIHADELVMQLNNGFMQALTGNFQKSSKGLLENYDVSMSRDSMVAGLEAIKIKVLARDDFRYSYFLWIDPSSGILLKSAQGRKGGKFIQVFEFVDFELAPDIKKIAFDPELKGVYKSRDIQPEEKLAAGSQIDQQISEDIISLSWMPSGFYQTGFYIKESRDGKVYSRLYSDGLAAFTVFVTMAKEKSAPARISRLGSTVAATKQLSDDGKFYDVTVVGELPVKTVKKMMLSRQ